MKFGAGPARSAISAIAVAMLLSSCTSGTGPSTKEPDIGPIMKVDSVTDMVLPLDAYRYSQRDYITIRRAAWRLIRDCVRRFGGDYSLPESASVADVPRIEHDNARRYGLFDADSAAERGYNLPPDQLPPEPDKTVGWNPSDTEKMLVRGLPDGAANVPTDTQGKPLPEGGCSGEADRMLEDGATHPSDDSLGDRLAVEAHHKSENDSRVRAAMAKWSECMKRSGYSYQSIWDPNDKKWPDPASDEEIATAKTDVACKKESNLVPIWLTVETAYHKQALEEHAQDLAGLNEYVSITTRNAARVVAGG